MSLPEYVARLRRAVGPVPLVLPSVTVIILDAAGRMLLVRPAGSDAWVAPGGIVDEGEAPADAARREAWEETGLDVELTALQGVYAGPEFRVVYPHGDVSDYVMTVYRARTPDAVPRPRDAEIAELRWVARDELDGLPLAPWARVVVPAGFGPLAEAGALTSRWRPPPDAAE